MCPAMTGRRGREPLTQLEQQIQAMTEYFRRGCKGDGPGTVGVEVEHFVTAQD